MPLHFDLYYDINYKHKFRTVVCGICDGGEFDTPGLTSWTEEGETYFYHGLDWFRHATGFTSTAPVVSCHDNLGMDEDPPNARKTVYFGGNGNFVLTGYAYQGAFSPSMPSVVAVRSLYIAGRSFDPDLNQGNNFLETDIAVHAYEWEYHPTPDVSIDMILFTIDPLGDGSSTLRAFAVSKNALEKATTPRYNVLAEPDPDSGYGTYEDSPESVDEGEIPGGEDGFLPVTSGVNMYLINGANLKMLSDSLWGRDQDIFDMLWKKFQNLKFNPISGIIGVYQLPSVFEPSGSGSSVIHMAGTDIIGASGVPVRAGLKQAECWITVPEYTGSYKDYMSTEYILHLPFCGAVTLDPSCIVGGRLHIVYRCDPSNGNCAAVVYAYPAARANGNHVSGPIASATGNCAVQVPITGNDNGTAELVGTFTGGMQSLMAGNLGGLAAADIKIKTGLYTRNTSICGSHAGNVAVCTNLTVFLEAHYPAISNPGEIYNSSFGRPSNVEGVVSQFPGYSRFSGVHAEIAGATDYEQAEIERLLHEGVFV